MAQYTIDFFQLAITPTPQFGTVAQVFDRAIELGNVTVAEESHTWELRYLERAADGLSYRGALAKLRMRDLPAKARAGEEESELELEDGYGLLEKAFFVYYVDRSLLLWQSNKHCGGAGRLRALLRIAGAADVAISAVVQAGAVERLLQSNGIMKSVKVTIAQPTNPDVYRDTGFGDSVMGILANSGGDRITVEVRTDGRLRHGRPLLATLKDAIVSLVKQDDVEAAQVEMIEGEDLVAPIDLVADRIRSYQQVVQAGRYPDPEAMYGAIQRALIERSGELDAIFGPRHARPQ